MTSLRINLIGLALLLPLLFGAGCDRASAPPTPLAVEELPAAFEKAFTKAKPEAKELASQVVAAVQAKDYSKAFQGLQTLRSQPDLTKEQTGVMSRGLLTVNTLLQAAQAQGDAKAAETIKVYQQTK
jgi:hypothetical protein